MLAMSLLSVVLIAVAGFVLAGRRAALSANGVLADLHSRPGYHGLYTALIVVLVGLAVYLLLNIVGSYYLGSSMRAALAELDPTLSGLQAGTVLADARAIATGGVASTEDALRNELSKLYASTEGLRVWVVALATVAAAIAAIPVMSAGKPCSSFWRWTTKPAALS